MKKKHRSIKRDISGEDSPEKADLKPERIDKPAIKQDRIDFAISYIMTLVLVLISIFLFLPFLFKIFANKLIACGMTLLFIPLLRVVVDLLLSDKKVSLKPRDLLRNYLFLLISLIFQLLLLVLILPAIALPLIAIAGGCIILAVMIFIIIWFLQSQFGLHLGRDIPFAEVKEGAYLVGIGIVAETIMITIIKIGNRYLDHFFDLYASLIFYIENKIREII